MINLSKLAPVSVIIPCYKCFDTIYRAVESVHVQTWRPSQVLLIEDFSDDGTLEYLCELVKKYPDGWLKLIPLLKNSGPGYARNIGWENAKFPYIAFLDSDDTWHPQKIEIQTLWMINNPDAILTGHACLDFSLKSEKKSKARLVVNNSEFNPVNQRELLFSNQFSTPSIMIKNVIPERFLSNKRYAEDFLLWCEISLNGYPCYRCDDYLAYLHKAEYGEGGLSENLYYMELGELSAYYHLKKSGKIGWILEIILLTWSILKYIRRVILVFVRKRQL
jgi:glycosyltransferase involved in cell wall biosynthesis